MADHMTADGDLAEFYGLVCKAQYEAIKRGRVRHYADGRKVCRKYKAGDPLPWIHSFSVPGETRVNLKLLVQLFKRGKLVEFFRAGTRSPRAFALPLNERVKMADIAVDELIAEGVPLEPQL